ncbi:GIY-YIG nuclease family protein [Okeania sp. SIO2B3]|uniref:GIY-YIG nuclease family protein n=1 Tax=Okeania sp. SIO2B3 TaxID=2607784 RepID=UPI0013C15D92|nr:GIY-YIG nuclease family protein [Okeania sp. SIO2B3]NET45973.1 hypothetical protein [Okeania sp. SIO2B3]
MKQLNLFDYSSNSINKQPIITMSQGSLENWKTKIFKYQQQIITEKSSIEQLTLFDLDSCSNRLSAENINPFALKLHNCEFYEHKPQQHDDSNCIYFIIDNNLPLLLYIGESQNSPRKRWKGTHHCKNYIFNYIELHRQYKLEVAVVTAFYWDVPVEKKLRQQLESELIEKWRSPFNKESWKFWGQPFGKI